MAQSAQPRDATMSPVQRMGSRSGPTTPGAPTPMSARAGAPGTDGADDAAKTAPKVNAVVHVPYLSPAQIERLSARARANKISETRWDQIRLGACAFIAAVAAKMGCPQRTTCTAQALYHRFHLFYPPSDFVANEVALACLFTSAKLNDTLKRVTEFIFASYALRYPDLVHTPQRMQSELQRSSEEGDGAVGGAAAQAAREALDRIDWVAHGRISESEIDAGALEQEKSRLLALERLLLQSICFNFQPRSQKNLNWVVKLARKWTIPKPACSLAWRIACDSHRTYAPLIYPPQTIAVASIYLAALLQVRTPVQSTPSFAAQELIDQTLRASSAAQWELQLTTSMEDAQDVVHYILDLYTSLSTSAAQAVASYAHTAGSNDPPAPLEPKRSLPDYVIHPPPLGLLDWCLGWRRGKDCSAATLGDLLTQIKIELRQREQPQAEAPTPDLPRAEHERLTKRKRTVRQARSSDELPPHLCMGAGADAEDKSRRVKATRYLFS